MKRYCVSFFGMIGLAWLGVNPLPGQTPMAVPKNNVPAGAPVVVVGLESPGCMATKTVCVPEHTTKTISKEFYSSGTEPLCVRNLRGFGGGGGTCDSDNCGTPITRHYLIKKIRDCDQDATKCVPVQVPACQGNNCVHPVGTQSCVQSGTISSEMITVAPGTMKKGN